MENRFLKGVLAWIAGTVALTAMMMIAAQLGMPKMEPPKILANTTGFPLVMGWVMHFMIGIIFALIYNYVISGMVASIASVWAKGAIFGVIAFMLAAISMFIMMKIFPNMQLPEGSMLMIVMGAMMGHILFGIVTAYIIERK